MNKELELPVVPQRIAVISSPTAAGLQDFLEQLHNNQHGFVFYTKLFPAVMQGNEAPRSIMNALGNIYDFEELFDAVAIIRGGGSQLDLACFDQYELAAHVAQFPLPVITGIGHEKDDTVVDLVAHTRMKTPTAVAEFLISGALKFSQELNELEKQFTELVNDQLEDNRIRLSEVAGQLNKLVKQLMSLQQNKLNICSFQLANISQAYLRAQASELKQISTEAKNITSSFVVRQNHLLDFSGNKLSFVYRSHLQKSKNELSQFEHLIKIQAQEVIRSEKKSLNAMEQKLRLVDPMNVLKRGYSMTLLNGKIIKSVRQIKVGDLIETKLGDGTIESAIEKISNKE
jgi:exodeoxyribonuclease VII large subunit